MSDNSAIEWTDASWNPVTGCTKVSRGCDHCYAETFAERWRGTEGHYFENGFDVQLRPDKLTLPYRWRKPRKVFVNSMSDLFHDDVPKDYIARVFGVMAQTPQHTYQILTKRHGRMRSLLNDEGFKVWTWAAQNEGRTGCHEVNTTWPLPNVWLGVSVEDQKATDLRVVPLLDTPAAIRWVSCEPLLGPVDLEWCAGVAALSPDWNRGTGAPHPLLDWVVVGGESGPGARPMHPAWARAIRDQCERAGVPFLFKQWGAWAGHSTPDTSWNRTEPHAWVNVDTGTAVDEASALADIPGGYQGMWRVGKGAAGRSLDGRTWDEYPSPVGVGGV